jgi:hypothetical protein
MPLKILSSYNSLLYFIEDKEIIDEICSNFYEKQSSINLEKNNIWNILLKKTYNNQHHYTNRKSVEHLKFKLHQYKNKHLLYNLLKYLSLEHFEVKRGRNILQVEKIESFQVLQNNIDITPIYAMAISEYIQLYSPTEKIQYLKKSIQHNAIPLPHRFLSLEVFSDNHFHLGGGNNFNYRLHKILQDPSKVNAKKLPHNYRLNNIKEPQSIKFIFYATSILEKILLGYIIYNNRDFYNKEDIQNNQKNFKNNLLFFSEAMIKNKISLLDKILVSSEKKNSLYDIRPKTNKVFFKYLSTSNYYSRLVLIIMQHNLKNEIHQADTLLWILFTEIIRDHKNNFLKDFIFIYMSLRNIIHSLIIQEQQDGGLEYFSSYSKSSIRRDKKNHELYDTFSSILDKNYTFYIEGRIIFHSKQIEIAEDITRWFQAFIHTSSKIKNSNNKIKFMFHYKKAKEKKKILEDDKSFFLPARHHDSRKKIFQKTLVFLNFLGNKRYSQYKIYLKLNEKDSNFLNYFALKNSAIKEINPKKNYVIVNLHYLVSGIDAASLEYNAPPEVFAPVFNYVKYSRKLLHKPFQFSFHAGEDVEDIVSSLRTIVESVIFLGLKKGDRLGHALSLGFDYEKSFIEFHNLLTTKEKALDNATFLYFIFYSLFHENNRHQFLDIFEQKILQLSSEVYNSNYTVHQHINAWLLRRNSPIMLKKIINRDIKSKNENIIDNSQNFIHNSANFLKHCTSNSYYQHKRLYQYKLFFKYALQDVFKLKIKENNFYNRRYQLARSDSIAWEILLKYHFETNVRHKGEESIEEEFYSAETIEIAQDLIMEHVIAKNDIIIEVMPTSNLLNSQIQSYSKHPLFRFKPVDGNLKKYNNYNIRETPLKIIVNTDNPGFQATSYLNELFLINEAGIKLGYNHKDIESYINEIVELGNMIFTGTAPQE